MATQSKTTSGGKLENPINGFNGSTGVVVFLGLVLLSAGIAFISCSRIIEWSDWLKELLLQIYCLVVVLGWFSFTASTHSRYFFHRLWSYGLIGGVIMAMIVTPYPVFFWFSLLVTVGMGTVDIIDNVPDRRDLFSTCIYTTWIIAGAVITLGRTSYLPYANPVLAISQIHFLLDIRFLITALVFLSFVWKAVVKAFDKGVPIIPPLPQIKLQDMAVKSDDIVATVLQPFIIIIDAILVVIQKITNAIWQVVATVTIYLYRTGSNLANYFIDLVLNSKIWLSIFRVLYTFIAIISITLIIKGISPSIRNYLISNTSPSSISSENKSSIILFAVIYTFILIVIASICRIWRILDKPLGKAAFGGSMLVIAWFLSGCVLYGLKLFDVFNLSGFESLGVYTLLIFLIIGSVFIFQVIKRLGKRAV